MPDVHPLDPDLPPEVIQRIVELHIWVGVDRRGSETVLSHTVLGADARSAYQKPLIYGDRQAAEAMEFRARQIVASTDRASDRLVRAELRAFRWQG
jgi:hypothetical protein